MSDVKIEIEVETNPDHAQVAGEMRPVEEDKAPDFDPMGLERRTVERLCALVEVTERLYRDDLGKRDVRNLAYYRGEFWSGDGFVVPGNGGAERAEQNEVFPILDEMSSQLVLKLPQVELADHRVHSEDEPPTRKADPTYWGRRVGRALNVFAEQAELDEVMSEIVACSLVFRKGGILKTTWDSTSAMCDWTAMLPWEVFFDPQAKKLKHVSWCFERFPLHYDDYADRVRVGVYSKENAHRINPDVFPRSLVEDIKADPTEMDARRRSLAEYLLVHEFYDFRRGVLYHLHLDTGTVLMAAPIPFGNPYSLCVLNLGIGRLEGVADVDLLASGQANVNELVSGRMQMARTIAPKIMVDRRFFKSDDEFEQWRKGGANSVTLVDKPSEYASLEEGMAVTPAPQTTPDYRAALEDGVEHLRYQAGVGFRTPQNIRTAEEVTSLRAGQSNRMEVKSGRVVRCVRNGFKLSLRALQMAVENAEDLGWDPQGLYRATVAGVPYAQWRDEVLAPESLHAFRVLPFSPLMEDPVTRRKNLRELLPQLADPVELVKRIDHTELAREIQELYGMRPSLVTVPPPEPVPGEAAPEAAGGGGGTPDMSALAGLLGGGAPPPGGALPAGGSPAALPLPELPPPGVLEQIGSIGEPPSGAPGGAPGGVPAGPPPTPMLRQFIAKLNGDLLA